MPYKISFECSQKLTDAQLAVFRKAIEDASDVVCDNIPDIDDVPEYFYTALTQEEIG